jgi:uncharacterized membrane protein YdbT with pleckstrin-like domain
MVQFLHLYTNNVLSNQFDLQCDVICLSVINSLLPADFVPPSENSSSNGTSAGTVAGIVAAVVVVIFLILGILWWKGCLGQKISMRHGIF